ncbi:MAG TPA: formylglycine-generating enzyme family protein [Nocardioidaceae bacterium]|nr:formylglycine-generating enzyme family protein [Nocardioidaceae bacterium]
MSSSATGRIDDVVLVPGGDYRLGSDAHYAEEKPVRSVSVDEFWMDRYSITNEQYAAFVAATGYVSVAERPLDPHDFPGAPAENLLPGSMVFTRTRGPVDLRHISQWWTWTPGACWRRPEGPGSDVDARADHPVVQVAYEDAAAYAEWDAALLPTEAQWEVAARGGLDSAPYTWGDGPERPGERLANYWHGDFPWRASEGYGATAAVGSFKANGYGLFDMAGNVWEWTTDWYVDERREAVDAPVCCAPGSPAPTAEDSVDPAQPQFPVPRRVIKGGSFLCADEYCMRYRPAARRPQMIDTGMSHIGFQCVRSAA